MENIIETLMSYNILSTNEPLWVLFIVITSLLWALLMYSRYGHLTLAYLMLILSLSMWFIVSWATTGIQLYLMCFYATPVIGLIGIWIYYLRKKPQTTRQTIK